MNNGPTEKNVLLIENNPGIAAFFKAWFNKVLPKINLNIVHSFEECLTVIKKIQPDFIIVDSNFPGINDPREVQKLKESGINTNIIIMANFNEFITCEPDFLKPAIKQNEFIKFPPSIKFVINQN